MSISAEHAAYINTVVQVVHREFGSDLVGVYLFGSAAYGAYQEVLSDLDMQAVVSTSPRAKHLRHLADQLSSTRLPCPARKLEFVLYSLRAVQPAHRHPLFALNFNTGHGIPDVFSLAPSPSESHWFLLDIAVGRTLGQALWGPTAESIFAPIPRLWALEALLDSLDWHERHEPSSVNAVLNACRGWRYAATDVWGSKAAGGQWVNAQQNPFLIVDQALAARSSGASPPPQELAPFMSAVRRAIEQAIRTDVPTEEEIT